MNTNPSRLAAWDRPSNLIADSKDQHSRERTKLDVVAWSWGQVFGLKYAFQIGCLYGSQPGETAFKIRPLVKEPFR